MTVELWWCSTDAARVTTAIEGRALRDVDDETARRVAALARPDDRRRVLLTHALLRRVLAPLVGAAPAAVPIRRRCARCGSSAHGRPYVAGRHERLDVSLAHGGGLGVVAVAAGPLAGLRVGVDVERSPVAAVLRGGLLAAMSPSELAANLTRPDPERAHLRSWTGKEAVGKATGLGMGDHLVGLDVSAAGDGADWSPLRGAGPGERWVAFPPAVTPDDVDGSRHVLAVALVDGAVDSRAGSTGPMG